MLGKTVSPRLEKLEKEFMQSGGEWKEYRIGDLFEIRPTKNYGYTNKKLFERQGDGPVVVNSSRSNGIGGYVDLDSTELGNIITFSDTTTSDSIFYQPLPFIGYSHVQGMFPCNPAVWNRRSLLYFCSIFRQRTAGLFDYGNKFNRKKAANILVQLPTKNGKLDYAFMERYIEELEAYLEATGLKNYALNADDVKALDEFEEMSYITPSPKNNNTQSSITDKRYWAAFSLLQLFGASTRGKRLKSFDRIAGDLPFVTAGEQNTGISDFIGNEVDIFEANTTTIDMFGSAKYRNYRYGADDHVAVVHTEKLNKYAALFTTAAIHRASHIDKFSYSNNFYASDADELYISLPTKGNIPDYTFMERFIHAVQKLVIKDVVLWTKKKMKAYRKVIGTE